MGSVRVLYSLVLWEDIHNTAKEYLSRACERSGPLVHALIECLLVTAPENRDTVHTHSSQMVLPNRMQSRMHVELVFSVVFTVTDTVL